MDELSISGQPVVSCAGYVIWIGLTYNGRRDRCEMPATDRALYDRCVFGLEVTAVDHALARRLYAAATAARPDGQSGPVAVASKSPSPNVGDAR